MKYLPKLLVVVALFGLTACGEKVEVPPAFKGKVLTSAGWKPEIYEPSKFRLEACWAYCDKLVLIEASDQGMQESFRLFMPKDQLNVAFDIRFTLSLRSDDASINSIVARVPADVDDYGRSVVPATKVYATYGQPILREKIRSVVAEYTIDELTANREKINSRIYEEITGSLKDTPLTVRRIAFADIQYPEVIVNAKEAAAQRKAEIEQARADRQVQEVKLQTELQKVKAEAAIREAKAEAAKRENEIFAASVSERYLQYKRLEVLELMAKNERAVFVPVEAIGTLGLEQRILSK